MVRVLRGSGVGSVNRIAENLREVEERIALAAEGCGRAAGEIAGLPGLRLRGLMGIGPLAPPAGGPEAGQEATRRSFQLLARLFGQLPAEHRQVLSMGMSGDFELAIAEGSTMVRIGTGIFG